MAKRVIVDIDAGTDDAFALLILLKADQDKQIKIEAICCTMGNTTLENVCRNVVRFLEIAGRTDIPVFRGATEQIIYKTDEIRRFHGRDGLGDLEHDHEPDLSIIKDVPSPVAMYNIAKMSKGHVYLVCLGPLTNPALAMKLYPDFGGCLKEIYVMGGNYKGVGNAGKSAEFNFFVDPEAAHIVLNRSKCPIVVMRWETCNSASIDFEWRFNVFGKSDNAYVKLLNRVDSAIYRVANRDSWISCDAFLVAAFLYPECELNSVNYHGTVELHGSETRGQMVLDHTGVEKPNLRLIKKFCVERFKCILLEAVVS